MGTANLGLYTLTAGVSTRANMMSYWNANMAILDALFASGLQLIGENVVQILAGNGTHGVELRSYDGRGTYVDFSLDDVVDYSVRLLCSTSGQLIVYDNLYAINNVSAATFTDRTPHFAGDALAAIRKIRATKKGEIDHATLPDFAVNPYQDAKGEWWPGRSLGDMVSVLTVAIQQLAASYDAAIAERDLKIEKLSKRIDALAAKLPA